MNKPPTTAEARSLWIPGRPMAKQRPRAGANGLFYTPDPTGYEERVAAAWIEAHGRNPFTGPVRVLLSFWSGSRVGVDILVTPLPPEKWGRPDLDNLCKSVLDALGPDNSRETRRQAKELGVKPEGVAWNDDAQIVELKAEKVRV